MSVDALPPEQLEQALAAYPLPAELSGLHLTPARQSDLECLKEQLGRLPRGVVAIADRCACGAPTVVATSPRLPHGEPFPTVFYLTHPALTKALSRLEADKQMPLFQEWVLSTEELRESYARAHRAYIGAREYVGQLVGITAVEEIEDYSAGGMPQRVKCLHALAGHSLAAGPGVNPVGDAALERLREAGQWDPQKCFCAG